MLWGPWGGTPLPPEGVCRAEGGAVWVGQRGGQQLGTLLCGGQVRAQPSCRAHGPAALLSGRTAQRRLSSSNTSHGRSHRTPDQGNSRTPVLTQGPGVSGWEGPSRRQEAMVIQQCPPLSEPSTPLKGYSHLKVGVQPCCHPTLQTQNPRLRATPQSHPACKPQLWELDTGLALGTLARPPALLPVNLRKPLRHTSRRRSHKPDPGGHSARGARRDATADSRPGDEVAAPEAGRCGSREGAPPRVPARPPAACPRGGGGRKRRRSGSQINSFLLEKITGCFILRVGITQPHAGQEEGPERQAPRAEARSRRRPGRWPPHSTPASPSRTCLGPGGKPAGPPLPGQAGVGLGGSLAQAAVSRQHVSHLANDCSSLSKKHF